MKLITTLFSLLIILPTISLAEPPSFQVDPSPIPLHDNQSSLNPAHYVQTPVPAPALPQKVETSQVTFLEAVSATLVEREESVLIIAEEPKGAGAGVLVTIEDQDHKFIEVYTLVKIDGKTFASFPPEVVEQHEPGRYLVRGESGQLLGISVRSDGLPVWLEVTVGESPTDPTDPTDPVDPPDSITPEQLAKVEAIAKQGAASLNDPITQASIRDNLATTLATLPPEKDAALAAVRNAIATGLLDAEVDPPYKDWKGKFRKPLSDYIETLPLNSGADVKAVFDAVAKGLNPTTASTLPPSKIVMYTAPGCINCLRWKAEVYPYLENIGWDIEEVTNTTIPVPQFEIHDGGRISPRVVGFMDISQFSRVVKQMKDL